MYKKERNEAVVKMRQDGATYKDIAVHFGFSHDRGRQIVKDCGRRLRWQLIRDRHVIDGIDVDEGMRDYYSSVRVRM